MVNKVGRMRPGAKAAAAFVIFIFLCGLVESAWAHKLTEREKKYLQKKGAIVFVSQTVYPPFEFVSPEGEHTGMCVELLRWMATELGFKARFTNAAFKNAQDAVLSGKADILTSLFYSKNRDKKFDFTGEIFKVPASIFVLADRPDIKNINDLQGKTIAMQAGDYAQEFLNSKHISCQVIHTKNFAEATDLVIAGKADAIIGDEQIVLYHIYSHSLARHIKKVGQPLYVGQNCMAAREGNAVLIGILNKGIERARETGILKKINEKWLGTRYTIKESWLYQYSDHILVIGLALIFLALGIWSWNLNLRRKVEKRTRELAKSEGALRAILNNSPMGVGLLRGELADWHNPAMTKMLGYRPEEVKGRDTKFLYRNPEAWRADRNKVKQGLKKNQPIAFETSWMRRDGSVFDCLLRYSPVSGSGPDQTIVILAEDITERKLARQALLESESRYRSLFENASDAIFIHDMTGRFLEINHVACERLGYSKDELLRMKPQDVDLPKYAAKVPAKIEEIKKRGFLIFESVHRAKDGTHIPTELSSSLIFYKGTRSILSIARDITERKQVENLILLQRDLATRLGFCNELPKALDLCLEAALTVNGLDWGWVYLVDAETGDLNLVTSKNAPLHFVERVYFFDGRSPQAQLVARGEPVYSEYGSPPDLWCDGSRRDGSDENAKRQGIAIMPVKHEGQVIAAINMVSSGQAEIPEFARHSLESIASQIGSVLARIKAEEAKRVSEERLMAAIEAIDEGFVIYDHQDRLAVCNAKYRDIYDKSAELFVPGTKFEYLVRESVRRGQFPQALGNEEAWIQNRLNQHRQADRSMEQELSEGRWVKISDRRTPEGSTVGFRVDITEMKLSEKRIQAALEEKETLLREIHHRVKNNLQVVSSLLNLQAQTIKDPGALAAFLETQGRVNSMAMVHEILYQSENFSEIKLQDYLEMLTRQLVGMFATLSGQVRIEIGAEGVFLAMDHAMPCGIIVTELVTNALKYAFPNGRGGKISILARQGEDGWVELMVADDGVGMPGDMDIASLTTLGASLITQLAEDQLEGSYKVQSGPGTRWVIRWPIDPKR